MACVRAYPLQERNHILWIWMGRAAESQPVCEAPSHSWHDDPRYQFQGDTYHYKAPYQLIHDNLLDLSHLGYVHTRTIGGNAQIHVKPEMTIEDGPDWVRVVRQMRDSQPPPTYLEAGRLRAASTAGRRSSSESAISSSGRAAWTLAQAS
jgi:phenylpropionate dioxygenase-like ring-hydroxylating dioxygenase large terminal subunit